MHPNLGHIFLEVEVSLWLWYCFHLQHDVWSDEMHERLPNSVQVRVERGGGGIGTGKTCQGGIIIIISPVCCSKGRNMWVWNDGHPFFMTQLVINMGLGEEMERKTERKRDGQKGIVSAFKQSCQDVTVFFIWYWKKNHLKCFPSCAMPDCCWGGRNYTHFHVLLTVAASWLRKTH